MRLVRIIGLFLGMSLGLILMAAVSAWGGAVEFPSELAAVKKATVIFRGTCFGDLKRSPPAPCEIRAEERDPKSAGNKTLYVVIYTPDGKELQAVSSFRISVEKVLFFLKIVEAE